MRTHRLDKHNDETSTREGLPRGLLALPSPPAGAPREGASLALGRCGAAVEGLPYTLWVERDRVKLLLPLGYLVDEGDWDRLHGRFSFYTAEAGLVTMPGVRRVLPVALSWSPREKRRQSMS